MDRPSDVLGGGIRTYVTLAFTDLCGSTALANRLDPDALAAVLGSVRRVTGAIVDARGGTVLQVYGDGLLSVYRGAASGERALAAALDIHAAVRGLTLPAGVPSLRLTMHSGIHAGLVLLRPGDEAIGRATGVAARLSDAAGPDEILVSERTLGLALEGLELGPVRTVPVSGAGDRIAALPVLGVRSGTGGRRTPFLGRADLIKAITASLLSAEPACVAVTGPPGQGKSRLSEEMAVRAADAEVAVLRGHAAPGDSASTLQPFREIDMGAARLLGEDPQGSGDDLTVLGQALTDRLLRLAARRRVLLILDDWHWADTASLQVLERLRSDGRGIAVLLLAREAAPGALPLAADRVFDLPPIAEAAAIALVRHLRPELDTLDARRVSRLAGGNPLYLEELCLLSAQALVGLLAAEPATDEIGRIAAIVEARVRALPSELSQLLDAAAVMGGECPLPLLAQLAGVTPDSTRFARLAELDLLIPSLVPGNRRFKHGIIRNVVYQLMPLEHRRALHLRVAERVGAAPPDPTVDRDELLAWHYGESGQHALALVHAERAGDRVVAAASIDRAQLHYARALRAIEQLGDDHHADRVRLIGKYGFACVYDSDRSQLALFDRAAAAAGARGDRHGEAVARFWHGFVCHGSGLAGRAIASIGRALVLAAPEGKDVAVDPAPSGLACRGSDLSRAEVTALGRALALTDVPGQSPFVVQLRATLGQALASAGCYAAGEQLLDSAIAVKSTHRSGRNVPVGTAYSLALKAALLGDTGRFVEAHALIDEALAMVAGARHPVEGSVIGWAAAVRYWQGDWAGLLAIAEQGCEVALRIEAVYIHAISRAFASYARWRLTGATDAESALADAVACMVDRDKELALSIACGCLAEMEAARGDRAATRAALARTYARARDGEPFGVAAAARAAAGLLAPSDPDRARRMLGHARSNAHRRGSLHELARCNLAEAELGLVTPDVAVRRLAEAAAGFERMRMAGDLARARALIPAT